MMRQMTQATARQLWLYMLVLCVTTTASAAGQGSVESDRAALVALYDATNGDNWTNRDNWKSTEPLDTWAGVETDADGRVTNLELTRNSLSGTIPAELGNLTRLEVLDLLGNSLSGTIPTELGNLTGLRGLRLANNDLSGAIPAELGNLTGLERLSFTNNNLSGTIPIELATLRALEWLYLFGNNLSGTIPPWLGDLTGLEVLHLGRNELSGTIPVELGNLTRMTSLSLSANNFTGTIPAEFGNLTRLSHLWLYGNGLSGGIPADFGKLRNLELLHLYENDLSGAIPAQLAGLGAMRDLRLSPGNEDMCAPNDPALLAWLEGIETLQWAGRACSGGAADYDPTVTITSDAREPVTGPFSITVYFSESVTGFELEDLVVGNGFASELEGDDERVKYIATVTPTASGTVTVDIPAGAAEDDAGNESTAARQFSIEAEVVPLDTTAPTVTISTTAEAPVTGPFTITVVFSEPVSGFELADLVVGNGSASELEGSEATYMATVTPAASGTVTVDIAAGAAEDGAGNPSAAADQFSITADTAAPTVTIASAASEPVTGPFTITVVFSEPVSGLELADLAVGNGSASELAGSEAAYTATVTPAASGTVTVDIAAGAAEDDAGNASAAAEQFSITADLTPVPALPLVGAVALAALLLVGGIRRRRGVLTTTA